MKLRERIAKGLWEKHNPPTSGFVTWERLTGRARDDYLSDADSIVSILADPDDETVERVGLAFEKAWNSGDGDAFGLLPAIELTPDERNALARAALSSLGEG